MKLYYKVTRKKNTFFIIFFMANSERHKEQENYPISPNIIYYGDRTFNYIIIQEGIYLPVAQLHYTEAPNYFPIPDNYVVQTTWGWAGNCRTIQCFIYYIEGIPHYSICFGDNFKYQVVSVQSLFDVSVELHKVSFGLEINIFF